jgi:hypothetical protein
LLKFHLFASKYLSIATAQRKRTEMIKIALT